MWFNNRHPKSSTGLVDEGQVIRTSDRASGGSGRETRPLRHACNAQASEGIGIVDGATIAKLPFTSTAASQNCCMLHLVASKIAATVNDLFVLRLGERGEGRQ